MFKLTVLYVSASCWRSRSLFSLSVRIAFFCNSNSSKANDSCWSFSWVIFKYSDWLFSCAKNNHTTLDPCRSSAFSKHCHRNHSFHLICTPDLWGRQHRYLSLLTLWSAETGHSGFPSMVWPVFATLQLIWKILFPVALLCECVLNKSLQSRPTLCDPMDCSPPGSSVHGTLQTRILEWVVMLFSRGSNLCLLCLQHWQEDCLPLAPPGKCMYYVFTT